MTAVALFCLLTTLSTAFEHTYDINWKLIDGAYRPCNQTLANVSPTPHPTPGTTPLLIPTKATTAWLADEQTTTNSATSATLPSYLEHSDLGSGAGSGSSSGIGSGNDSGSGYGESGK